MRICHVIESSSGGSSRVLVELLRDQIAAGHDVTLIYSPIRADPPFTDAVEALGVGLRIRLLPMYRGVGPHDAVAAFRLWRALRELGPFDVLHGHSSKAGALSRIAALLLGRMVVIYTPHAFVTLAPDAHPVYGAIEWVASWFCDAILLGSEQEYDHARRRLHLPESRLRLIAMGVDLSQLPARDDARRALGLPEQGFVVGFVGRLAPQKNPLRLAHVLQLVARARPDLRFVIIGDGELRDALGAELDARGLRGATILARAMDGADAMPAFDCLVCTSDYESFGLIFAEALAAGVAIVSPPVGVAPQAITPGTGRLTSFEPEDIARGVLEIAALDEEARGAMADACRDRARRFDIRTTATQTRRLYEELLARKAGATS
ncbi:glycosyltransferase [Methylocystis echinoides]|uniref:glycosyltransferase n=1 Tax=Methylocystis echinoides TaxID=29468 RepID=UPI0024933F7F|nr:glycosyltransferase [Methylocystis echinoides]